MGVLRQLGLGSVVASLAMLASSAQADIVTFDDVANHTGAPFESGGLRFESPGSTYVWSGDGVHSDNGTLSLISGIGASFTITKVGGGMFSIDQFDAGLSWYTLGTTGEITVDGDLLTLTGNYQTFALTTLQNVSSVTVRFTLGDGYFAMDNIVWHDAGALPEPASFALVGLALLATGVARRRR
ncbi:PEP-CTERM sorting domain-containing protein [Roseateles sp.]|uniref:PEP-CTERM sorting domain-containing protein n=1 Tax=Roseateles sp. TaxID=1971397 RepID=UPI0025CD7528|nr:PEP-CTERM sorting domain-containing protein [Roseateles sp.]MBV8036427.1 PEP-CTERM sorting domain-containing protein [Roseateles sp.]